MSKILVIEDESSLREDIAELLTLEGYEVITACDGVEGVNNAINQQPDLIICDIMMPRLDGYEVLLDVRANSLTQFVPFIFLTAKAARDDLRTGMELGADDYVTKPFARLDLLRAIEKRLDLKTAQEREHQEQLEQFKSVLAHERGQRLLTERLIAIFSRDFRDPVEGILNSSQLLANYAEDVDEGRRLTHLNRIELSARHLLQMLDDMLIVAQIERGSLRFSPELVEPGQFFERIVNEFQALQGEAHRLVYECHFADAVYADPRLLRQVAANLIANAIKAAPDGGAVGVTLDGVDVEYILTVKHGGISSAGVASAPHGISADDEKGVGLGLAIVSQAVELHGGFLQIESQADAGTKVTVTFPIR